MRPFPNGRRAFFDSGEKILSQQGGPGRVLGPEPPPSSASRSDRVPLGYLSEREARGLEGEKGLYTQSPSGEWVFWDFKALTDWLKAGRSGS